MNAKNFSACPDVDAGYMGFANLDRIGDNADDVHAVADRVAESWTQLKNSAA